MPARGGGDPTSHDGCHGSHHGIYPIRSALATGALRALARPAHAVNTIHHIANRAAGVGEGAKRSKAEAGPSSRRPEEFSSTAPAKAPDI